MKEAIVEPDQPQLSNSPARSLLYDSTDVDSLKYHVMCRPGVGDNGRRVSLVVNHMKVSIDSLDKTFYHYNVKITSPDKEAIESKSLRGKVIDKLFQTCLPEFKNKGYVFDRKEHLYTLSPLPQETSEFSVTLEESFGLSNGGPGASKKSKHSSEPRLFMVLVNYVGEIPLSLFTQTFEGKKGCSTPHALRVLNIILRQLAIDRGCLLVRQSFFKDDSRNYFEVGGGLTGFHGFHSCFHMTKAGLSLNFDAAVTLILTPGPVLDFLLTNQNVKEARYIDWIKAKTMLKKLRIKTTHSNREFKITGLSEKPCYQQSFTMSKTDDDGSSDQVEITVCEYFQKHHGVGLTYSKYMPCLDVGKPKRPIYLPIELCSLVPLQRYTKALSPAQHANFVENTKQKPHDRMKALTDALKNQQYEKEPMLATCGINIQKQFMQVTGRVLEAPKLRIGKNENCTPCNGRWTFKNKQFLKPENIECWAIVNFSSGCDTSYLSRELINCGRSKGMKIERPYALVEENPQMRKSSPLARVDAMFEKLQDKLPGVPEFILCVLPERRTSDLYGPWKMRSLCTFGIITQCVCPAKITDQYLTNVLLKVNSKLGGVNSLLAIESRSCVPHVNDSPTMIVGMDVSHGPPGRADLPSIAAVVGSLSWPLISRYRAAVRAQSPRAEIIDSLFKQLVNGEDDGIMRELLVDFYSTSKGQKPKKIIIFRDGVGESQFSQVLNIELEQIKQAYLGLGEKEVPKFTVIVAQKNHHTRLFEAGANSNVPAGTIVDTDVVHPRNYDFYMCAHSVMTGTLRPVHYHVLLDEIGFSPDELQNFVHTLSYVYQRGNRAPSVVAPIAYAHHAARQVQQFLRIEEPTDTSSDISSLITGSFNIPDLPKLHDNVVDTMFFC